MTEHDTACHQWTHRHAVTQESKRSLLSEVSKHWHQARIVRSHPEMPLRSEHITAYG